VDDVPLGDVKTFAAKMKINYPVAITNDDVEKKFGGIAALPTTFLIDTQGRLVSRVQPGSHGAGRWSVALDAYDRQGRSVAPGVYLVRMRLGERTVATKKIILEP